MAQATLGLLTLFFVLARTLLLIGAPCTRPAPPDPPPPPPALPPAPYSGCDEPPAGAAAFLLAGTKRLGSLYTPPAGRLRC